MPFQGEPISGYSETNDLPGDDIRDHRVMPKRFAGMNVGDMDFDYGYREVREGVANGIAVVRERPAIDDDSR